MILSENTIAILTNFANYNPSIMFKPGNEISTLGQSKTFRATATVDETFEVEAGIGDLSKFLGIISAMNKPELNFKENQVVISSGKSKVNFTYSHPSTILTSKSSSKKLPESDVSFELEADILPSILKVSNILDTLHVKISGASGKLTISAVNVNDPTADSYDIEIGSTNKIFDFYFKKEYLKLIPIDYEVGISSQGIATFKSKNLEYNITVEHISSYEG